jgi:hypothetical protein
MEQNYLLPGNQHFTFCSGEKNQKSDNTLATLWEQNGKNRHNFVPSRTKSNIPNPITNIHYPSSKNFSVKKFQFGLLLKDFPIFAS